MGDRDKQINYNIGNAIADDKQNSRKTEGKSDQKCFVAHKTISQPISSFTSLNNSVTQALQARKWTIRKVIGLPQSHLSNTERWNSNFLLLILKFEYMLINLY